MDESQVYDESIEDNELFKEIQSKYNDLIIRATEDNWIICVPRMETLQRADISEMTIFEHVLVPDMEMLDSNFITLSKKYVQVHGNLLIVKNVDEVINKVHVLFKQVFYVKGLKYEVWCLEHPINKKQRTLKSTIVNLNSVQDCLKLLLIEYPRTTEIVQAAVESFVKSNPNLTTDSLENVEQQIRMLYAECMEQIVENKPFANKLSINLRLLMQVQLSVEVYMQHCFDKKLFYSIVNYKCYEDAKFNKIIRNLNYLHLKHFQIPAAYYECITVAKIELTKLNNFYTTLEKVNCLKKVFNCLKCLNSDSESLAPLTTDSLLHILTFLIIKTNINNWAANLAFLSRFQFNSSVNVNNEINFLLTTLEAAMEHIRSGVLHKTANKPEEETFSAPQANQGDLFEAAKAGNVEKVDELLKTPGETNRQCHPLCSCDQCESLGSRSSLSARDGRGRSLLHAACFGGHPRLVDYLLGSGLPADQADYFEATPLQCAAGRGFQNCTLLLLHGQADLNRRDLDGNTPLHLAALHGHENCVKALIYYSEYNSNLIDINRRNNMGDTPLHFASKWGYLSIVEILLQYSADPSVPNKRHQLPIDVAQNIYVKKILNKSNNISNQEEGPLRISYCQKRVDTKSKSPFKKIDRLLKAIEDDDLQLTRFYLGVNCDNHVEKDISADKEICHPLCTCEKCEKCPKGAENGRNSNNKDTVNVNNSNVEGFAPIHVAAKCGRTEILRLILDSGAVVNVRTFSHLKSALHLACIYNKPDVAKELLQCGNCDIDIRDSGGNTPLHDAVQFNNERMVEVLLLNGADAKIKNNLGETALDVAKMVKNRKIIRIIENHLRSS